MFVVHSLSSVWLFLRPHRLQTTRLLCTCDFPGKNTGVSCHFLLQGIFLTQGSNPCPPVSCTTSRFFTTEPPGKPPNQLYSIKKKTPGEGNGNPLQYSHLENPMDRGIWQATSMGWRRVGHSLATKPPPSSRY